MNTDEGNQPKMCRICLETEEPNKIITPCSCKGTTAFVHSYCMQKWIEKTPRLVIHGSPSYIKCQICKEKIYFTQQWKGCPQFCENGVGTMICFIIGLVILAAQLGGFIYGFYVIVSSESYPLLFLLFLFGGMVLIITIVCIKAYYDSKFRSKGKKINIIANQNAVAGQNGQKSQKNLLPQDELVTY